MRVISSLGTCWEEGSWCRMWLRGRGFGEVFVALDKSSNDLVAIKKVKVIGYNDRIESETRLLRECRSRYIVSFYDMIQTEGELWVCCCLGG